MSENDPDRVTGWVPPSVEPPPANPPLIDSRVGDGTTFSEITLRDLLAGLAMMGIEANPESSYEAADAAFIAYRAADAMLMERAK